MPIHKVVVHDHEIVTRVVYVDAKTKDIAEAHVCTSGIEGKVVGSKFLLGAVTSVEVVKEAPKGFPYCKTKGCGK